MDDNGQISVFKTETGSLLKGDYIKFSSCGQYKIEPEIDLGITTTFEDEQNTYYNEDSDLIESDESSHGLDEKDVKLFSPKVEEIDKVNKLQKRERFKCSICNYSTMRSDHMNLHLASHSTERPYQCPFCSYRSKRPYSLQEHIRTHTDERPYACNICDYSAKKKFNLDEHMKQHSKSRERPYHCSVCGHRSIRLSHLKIHMKLHIDYRPYKCNKCDYAAKRSGHLKSHMKKHGKE